MAATSSRASLVLSVAGKAHRTSVLLDALSTSGLVVAGDGVFKVRCRVSDARSGYVELLGQDGVAAAGQFLQQKGQQQTLRNYATQC